MTWKIIKKTESALPSIIYVKIHGGDITNAPTPSCYSRGRSRGRLRGGPRGSYRNWRNYRNDPRNHNVPARPQRDHHIIHHNNHITQIIGANNNNNILNMEMM